MNNNSTRESPRRIKSVQTASDILEQVQYLSQPTLMDVYEAVDVSKGTVHTYLETLVEEGFITKSGETYQLGLRFVTMGETARNQTQLYRVGQEEVENLAEKTGEWVHLTVEYQGMEVSIYQSSGDSAIAIDYHHRMRESPQYLHYTSSGKSILAFFDEDCVQEIIDQHGLVEQTSETITDSNVLFDELAKIRDQGYAVNDEEEIRGMRSVGAPIQGVDSNVWGGISVTAPMSRLSGEMFESEIPELIIQAANIIEVNLETTIMENR